MKVRVSEDEYYPFYEIDSGSDEIEIPDDEVSKLRDAKIAFDDAQRRLQEYWNEHWKKAKGANRCSAT